MVVADTMDQAETIRGEHNQRKGFSHGQNKIFRQK